MSWNDTIPFAEGYARLVKEATNPKPQPPPPTELLLSQIQMAHSVFQPRTFNGNMADSDEHQRVLANGIRLDREHKLKPLLVWWSGKCWRLIDGHHRLLAYQQVGKDRKRPLAIGAVPVEVFNGDLMGALKEATRRNSEDKLPMTKNDKFDRAWKFVALGAGSDISKSELAHLTKVSERAVGYMRAAHSDLRKLMAVDEFDGTSSPIFDDTKLLNMSWREAKKQCLDETPKDEEWEEKMAREWARRFAKTYGKKPAEQPKIMARALEIYSDPMVQGLCEIWRDEVEHARQAAEEADGPEE